MPRPETPRPLISRSALADGCHLILARQPDHPTALPSDLSGEERARYDRFVSKPAAAAFLHRRTTLRSLLAAATGLPPDHIAYDCNAFGKPQVKSHIAQVAFSVSQGLGMSAIAICRGTEVGVDIEHVSGADAAPDILPSLHSDEREHIAKSENAPVAFLDLWVRKEAVAKWAGTGFSQPANMWSCLNAGDRCVTQGLRHADHHISVATTHPTPFFVWSFGGWP